jgi:hypothetical protein
LATLGTRVAWRASNLRNNTSVATKPDPQGAGQHKHVTQLCSRQLPSLVSSQQQQLLTDMLCKCLTWVTAATRKHTASCHHKTFIATTGQL